MRIPSLTRFLLVLIVMTGFASVASAQAAPTCGVPGAPVCTATPRPTDPPTQAPAEQPAQPTADPTAAPTSTPTEAPLLPMPQAGACVASPNGNFRVNVRDIPSTEGEIVAVLSPNDAVLVLGEFTTDEGEDWVLSLPGYLLKAALRYGGEDCPVVTAAKLTKNSRVVIRIDFQAIDEEPEAAAGLYRDLLGRPIDPAAGGITKFGSRRLILKGDSSSATEDDDVCIEYPKLNPWGNRDGTICLPFDISSPTAVCVDTGSGQHCLVALPEGQESSGGDIEGEITTLPAALVPEDERPGLTLPLVFRAYDLPETARVIGIPNAPQADNDVCIEYTVNSWGSNHSICLAMDLSAGDVVCLDVGSGGSHCVVVVE